MHRTHLLVLASAAVLVACEVPTIISAPAEFAPAADVSPSPQVHVLNTQLRGIINPDIEPSSAYGHVQIRLRDNGDETFTVEWQGRIFNPSGESFSAGIVGIIDPDIEPPPPGAGDGDGGILVGTPVLTFFRLGAGDFVSCGVIDFDSQGIIDPEILPAEFALNMIINPEIHEARFLTVEHAAGAISGAFGAGTPEETVGGTETGPRVRCAI